MKQASLIIAAFVALASSVLAAEPSSHGVFNRTATPIGIIAIDVGGLSLDDFNRTEPITQFAVVDIDDVKYVKPQLSREDESKTMNSIQQLPAVGEGAGTKVDNSDSRRVEPTEPTVAEDDEWETIDLIGQILAIGGQAGTKVDDGNSERVESTEPSVAEDDEWETIDLIGRILAIGGGAEKGADKLHDEDDDSKRLCDEESWHGAATKADEGNSTEPAVAEDNESKTIHSIGRLLAVKEGARADGDDSRRLRSITRFL